MKNKESVRTINKPLIHEKSKKRNLSRIPESTKKV